MKLIFLIVLATWGVCAKKRFDEYSVYRISPTKQDHIDLLSNLASGRDFDFWTDVNNAGKPVKIMVKPKDKKAFIKTMLMNGMNPEVHIDDVQSLINNEKVGKYNRSQGMTWTDYYTLTDIYDWLQDLATANPGVVSVVTVGTTSEGRQIKGVKIAKKTNQRVVMIEGGIHAREWISPATVTWIINEILTSTDPTFRKIADSFEWHVFPSINPDGYDYSHTTDRFWRKNRSPQGECHGVDLNRNWAVHWMEQGTSNDTCACTYGGPSASSELETLSLSNYIRSVASRMDAYLAFHSSGQVILLPYGHTPEHLDNYNEMMQIGGKGIEAIAKRYGTKYTIGNVYEIEYPASGGSFDWVKQEFKTSMVMSHELRDTGLYGFTLPPNQIIPNNQEIIDGLIAIFQEGEKFGYVKLG